MEATIPAEAVLLPGALPAATHAVNLHAAVLPLPIVAAGAAAVVTAVVAVATVAVAVTVVAAAATVVVAAAEEEAAGKPEHSMSVTL